MTMAQILAWDNLCAVWQAVAGNRGAAGSDAISVDRFARYWEANPPRGIAQGLPISPLLCNLYLHRLDAKLTGRGRRLVRYADDFVVFCRSRVQAERVFAETGQGLADLRLRFEPSKTRITSFEQGFDFLGVHFESITYSFTWQKERV